jgi:hypothetical protein
MKPILDQQPEMAPPTKIAASLQSAIKLAIVQQLIVILVAGSLLDGGVVAQICIYAFAAYWGGTIVILARRRAAPTKLDIILVRSGYLVVCVISFILTFAIWSWREH